VKLLVTSLLLIFALISFAQEPAVEDTLIAVEKVHSPKKATIRSAVLPGWGQVYNKKAWKLPIVYGGIGTCAYFIDRNTKKYKLYRNALVAEFDDDPNTANNTIYDPSQLNQLTDDYRRLLDISYICLAAIYALNILDANVDAHLFTYDIGEDISMNVRPSFIQTDRVNTGIGLTINF